MFSIRSILKNRFALTGRMNFPICHILFSKTAARLLSEALQVVGREDRVICLPDDLSFGPINPPDPIAREDWMHRELGLDLTDEEWPIDQIEAFWDEALTTSARRIIWVSKLSAPEYGGFLEFVWRLGDAPCDIVEFGRQEIAYRGRDGILRRIQALVLGELAPEHVTETRYWERAVPLDAVAREHYRANWARLRGEDAPLRILDDSGMISVPITYFDDLLIACAIERWQKSARVIGEALVSFIDGPFYQVGDFVLGARLRALAQSGRLESQGDMAKPRFSEVRLPGSEDAPAPIT
jgi:Protein of unknown function/Domain of unknown function (DUF1835)